MLIRRKALPRQAITELQMVIERLEKNGGLILGQGNQVVVAGYTRAEIISKLSVSSVASFSVARGSDCSMSSFCQSR